MLKSDDHSEAVVDRLRQRGTLDDAAVERARRAAAAEAVRLDLCLVKLGLAPEAALAEACAAVLGTGLVEPSDYPAVPVEGVELPVAYLERARVLPIAIEEGRLVVAMADPLDRGQARAIEMKTGRKVEPRAARPADLDAALRRLYLRRRVGSPVEASQTDVERLRSIASDAPVVRFDDRILAAAV